MLELTGQRDGSGRWSEHLIDRRELNERIREWGLREEGVEKDYVIGWVLWGIGSEPRLSTSWAFKGGTCLKKCYLDTYRFSEDLDFTVLPGGPSGEAEVLPTLRGMLERVHEESGIEFLSREPRVRMRPDRRSAEGRIYYRGPRNAPQASRLKLDLTIAEVMVLPTIPQKIFHQYPDGLPEPATVRCYSLEEIFAEKIRALGERSSPRDLYDIVNLFRRKDLLPDSDLIRSVYAEKCQSKGLKSFTIEDLQMLPLREQLESEWGNMLARQLPELPPFVSFWEELPRVFAWLDGRSDTNTK